MRCTQVAEPSFLTMENRSPRLGDRGRYLPHANHNMTESSDNRSIRIFAATIATLIALVALYFAVIFNLWSRDTTPRGILANFNDWPEPVQQLKLNMDEGKQAHPSFQVFLLYGQPAQILSTVICKIDYSDDTFQSVKSVLSLSSVKPTDAIQVQRQIVATNSNGWWPSDASNAEYFACQNSINGDEGPLYLAAVDHKLNKIFVYYYFNF